MVERAADRLDMVKADGDPTHSPGLLFADAWQDRVERANSQVKDAQAANTSGPQSNALVEFGRSAFFGVVDNFRGAAQIADQVFSTHVFDAAVKAVPYYLYIEAPKAAEFGTSQWYAQQLGDAVSMLAGYAMFRKATNMAAGRVLGKEFSLEKLHANALNSEISSTAMLKLAGAEAGLSAGSGFLYGATLRPSDEQHVGTATFWSDRFGQGGHDATAFGIIGGINPYMGRALGAVAGAIEKAPTLSPAVADSLSLSSLTVKPGTMQFASDALTTTRNGLAAALRGPVLPGVITGAPIGAVNAELGALQQGNWTPTAKDLKEQVASMMFVGGVTGVGNWLTSPRSPHTYAGKTESGTVETNRSDTSNISAVHDMLRQKYSFAPTNSAGISGLTSTLHAYRFANDNMPRSANDNFPLAKAPNLQKLAVGYDGLFAGGFPVSLWSEAPTRFSMLEGGGSFAGRGMGTDSIGKSLQTSMSASGTESNSIPPTHHESTRAVSAFAAQVESGTPRSTTDSASSDLSEKKLPSMDEARAAALAALTHCLKKGDYKVARTLLDSHTLTVDDLKSDEIRDVTRSRLLSSLSNGATNSVQSLLDLELLAPKDVNSAVRTALAEKLSRGGAHMARHILDLNLHTPEDLKSDEIHQAVRSGIATTMLDWSEGQLPQILAFKLHSPEDLKSDEVRKVARSALAYTLSNDSIDSAKFILDLKALHDHEMDDCFKRFAQQGHVTTVIKAALSQGIGLNSALERSLGIPSLTQEIAGELFEDLKKRDSFWRDQQNVQLPFQTGATALGADLMLRYALESKASLHDTLHGFDDVVRLYERSGLENPKRFYDNVLRQVTRDNGVDDTGTSVSRLNEIARAFPENIDDVLEKAKRYPNVKMLQDLTDSLPDAKSVFASWPNLQRFAKLQQFVERGDLLPELEQLRSTRQDRLANWIEALAFHPDSRVATRFILDFWKAPERFLALGDGNASAEVQRLKKPSNYTDIPHLDLSASRLRDALINGTLDRLQVFSPMRVEYEVAGRDIDVSQELKRALGSRQENQPGEAKNVGKLFSEMNKLLKTTDFNLAQVLAGTELPVDIRQQLETVLYDEKFGAVRPATGLRMIAEIHRKSDPLAVVAGDDTVSCMGFGTGKNNVYMFNPNDSLFTVRLVRPDGSSRTIAQSVLTKDKDVKVLFPTILKEMEKPERSSLHTLFPQEALRGDKTVIAADNVQVHPNYQSARYEAALNAVYKDFFGQYARSHGKAENLRDDKMVIGKGYSSAVNSLPQEPNTYVPQAPVSYTDKSHDSVYSLSLTGLPTVQIRVLKKQDNAIAHRIEPQASIAHGISPLTFEDTLSVAYLESKIFQDNPSLLAGLHNMENGLIAKDINNADKNRPNLSVKYADQDGRVKGYMLAYEGTIEKGGTHDGTTGGDRSKQPVVYVADYSTDGRIGPNGEHVLSFVGGKLLLEFGKLYKENYLDKGNMIPILVNARDNTSYRLLLKQMKALGVKFGYDFEVQEGKPYQKGSSTMHDLLIIPHRRAESTAAEGERANS